MASVTDIVRTIDPTVTDDASLNFGVGSEWTNTITGDVFICTTSTAGAAIWEPTVIQEATLLADAKTQKVIFNKDTGNTYTWQDDHWLTADPVINSTPIEAATLLAGTVVNNVLTLQETGIGTGTCTHADTIYQPDYEGVYRPHTANVPVSSAGRVVENLFPYSEDNITGAWAASATFIDSEIVEFTANAEVLRHSVAYVPSGNSLAYSFDVELISGACDIYVDNSGGGSLLTPPLSTGYTITPTNVITRYVMGGAVTGSVLPRLQSSNGTNYPCRVRITKHMVEDITGRTNDTPSEYIATTNAAVRNVYADENGNSVAVNVVTEATGELIDKELITNPGTDQNDGTYKFDSTGDYYGRYNGVSADYIHTPDSPANSILSDIDIRVKVAMDDYTPAILNMFVSKLITLGNFGYDTYINTDGTLVFRTSVDGSAFVTSTSSEPNGLTNGTTNWLRWTWSESASEAKIYTSTDGTTWAQLGTTLTHVSAGIFNSTVEIAIGAQPTGGGSPMLGKLYEAQIYNGIDGTLAVSYNAADNPTNAGTHISSTTGETWTWTDIDSGKDISGSDWPPASGYNAGVSIVNGGLKVTTLTAWTRIVQTVTTIVGRRYVYSAAVDPSAVYTGLTYVSSATNGSGQYFLSTGITPGTTYTNSFIATTTSATIFLVTNTPILNVSTTWEYVRLHQESPTFEYSPAATNSLTYSTDLSLWVNVNSDLLKDQTDLLGVANNAYSVEDNNAAGYESVQLTTTIPNDSNAVVGRFFILKDNVVTTTRFPEVSVVLENGTVQSLGVSVDTSTGATGTRLDTGTTDYNIWETEKHWVITISVANNSTGNTAARIYFYPALGNVTLGTATVAAVGISSLIHSELHLDTTIDEVQYAPPIFTSGLADSIDRTSYQFDRANHQDTQGLWSGEFIPSWGSTQSGAYLNYFTVSPTAGSSELFGIYHHTVGGLLGSYDGSNPVPTVVTVHDPGNTIIAELAFGGNNIIVGTAGDYGTVKIYDGDFELGPQIEIGVNNIYPFGFRNLQFWNVPYDRAKLIGTRLMK